LRRWLKRLALAVLLLVGGWLLAVNLALNTPPLAAALDRRPDRFHVEWTAAWSVLPGRLHFRGLRLETRSARTVWTISADRAAVELDLPALRRRTVLIRSLRGDGVRSELRARQTESTPQPRPPRRPPSGQPPWTFELERIALAHVRQVRFAGLRLVGDGRLDGALRIVSGREMRLAPTRLRMSRAQLLRGTHVLVSGLDLDAVARLGPYLPRQHRGLAGWDFVDARLSARGRVDELPLLAKVTGPRPAAPGALAADLRVENGRLAPGSRLRLTAPSSTPRSRLTLTAAVEPDPPRLHLGLEGSGFVGGRGRDGKPVVQIESLTLDTATPQLAVRELVLAVRAGRQRRPLGPLPLVADARATGLRVDAPSSRLVLRGKLDRLDGRVDLGALLAREVAVADLAVDGATLRFDLLTRNGQPRKGGEPWAVRLDGARLTGIREVALGDLLLSGAATAGGSLALGRDGTLQVPHAHLALPTGRLDVGGETAARALAVDLEARVEPVRSGPGRGRELLRSTHGTATLRGEIASLRFLRPYLQRTPWLDVRGQGAFTADLTLAGGRFATGSRLLVRGAPVAATLLASEATGRGTVEVVVEPGPTQGVAAPPRTALRVRFDRFGLADRRRPKQAPYLRGSGLRILAIAPAAVDLTDPVQDFDATIDLPDAELPDLRVYDALLPAEAGLQLLGGRGRARLHLQASTATRRATGTATLTSDDARFRFQDLTLAGKVSLRAPLQTSDLTSNRFDLAGTRLELADVAYGNTTGEVAGGSGWWARADLPRASLVWSDPMSLRGDGQVLMKNSGPLLALFAHKSVLVRWFDQALLVDGVTARARFRLGDDLVAIDSLHATAGTGNLELRSRMRFSQAHRTGDLFVRYGRLAAGVELRDGRRDLKLRKAQEWYEAAAAAWASSP
jgi:hypothetical protein